MKGRINLSSGFAEMFEIVSSSCNLKGSVYLGFAMTTFEQRHDVGS